MRSGRTVRTHALTHTHTHTNAHTHHNNKVFSPQLLAVCLDLAVNSLRAGQAWPDAYMLASVDERMQGREPSYCREGAQITDVHGNYNGDEWRERER